MAKSTAMGAMLRKNKNGLSKKPKLEVSVYKTHGDDMLGSMDDTKYLKQDLKRQKESVREYEEILEKWVPEDVAAMAKKNVEQKLAEAKLSVTETRSRIKVRRK